MAKKARGQESKLAYQGHVMIENRYGLVLTNCVTRASGIGEQAAALLMASDLSRPAADHAAR